MVRFSAGFRYWLVLIILFAASFAFLQKLSGYSLVRLDISNSHSSSFRMYWKTQEDQGWSQSRSRGVYVNSRKKHFIFPVPVASSEIKALRFDPNARKGTRTEIREISIYNLRSSPIRFRSTEAFAGFKPNEQVTAIRNDVSLWFTSTDNDPWFVADFEPPEAQPFPWLLIAQGIVLGLILFGFGRYLPWLFDDLRWVPAGLLIAATAALAMATLTARNSNPDEKIHFLNAKYYSQHYAPARICAPETLHTYSDYGISRLTNREIAYVAGGRYLQLVDFIPSPEYMKLRYLNVALLFILALLAFRQASARMVLLPVLLTPQAWYLFSYYNSDALSLFAVILAAYQLFVPESMFRRLLDGERPPGYVLWVAGLAVLVAMQFWLKLNYVFYPIFLFMLAVSWWLVNRRIPSLNGQKPIIAIAALGVMLFLAWDVSRHAVNDFDMKARMAACQEQTAAKIYKPSTPLENTHYNLRLREKGYTLGDLIIKKQWPRRIFYTALGAYGYTEYLNDDRLFELMSVVIVLLLLYVSITLFVRGDAMARLSTLSALAAIAGVSLAALWMNWNNDFQPQGRYLMLYIPVIGSLMGMYSKLLNKTVIGILGGLAFMFAWYSFFAIGLVELPKAWQNLY